MDIHKNARLTPRGREHMVNLILGGKTPQAVSEAVGVCPRTVRKWVRRFQVEGLAGLQDRSSRPHRLYQPTPQATIDCIEGLRRQRLTGKAIAAEAGVSPATVGRVLKRARADHLDVPRVQELLAEIRTGRMEVVERRAEVPSPFASGLQFAFTAAFMYDNDRPEAESQGAGRLDRQLLEQIVRPERQ